MMAAGHTRTRVYGQIQGGEHILPENRAIIALSGQISKLINGYATKINCT
jgi:hypothetical protein